MEMDGNDSVEQDIVGSRILEAIEKLNERKKKLDELSLTDTETGQMKTRHGLDMCYNAHIVVESEHHLISGYTMDNDINDYASVIPLTRSSKELMGKVDVSAYRDHFSLINVSNLYREGTYAYIPTYGRGSPLGTKGVGGEQYASGNFICDNEMDLYTCPQCREMHYRFSFPNGLKKRVWYRVYSTDACRSCQVVKRCNTSKMGRWIKR